MIWATSGRDVLVEAGAPMNSGGATPHPNRPPQGGREPNASAHPNGALAETSAQSPMNVRKIGHVVFRVRDVDRSVRFYTEVLNFRVTEPGRNGMVFLNIGSDHHTIALMPAGEGGAARQPDEGHLGVDHFAMEVESIDTLIAMREFLKQRGVTIIGEGRRPQGAHVGVEFLDPDGYHIELYCEMDQVGPDNRPRPFDRANIARTLEEARDNPLPGTW
jgi:catechol 2,3-dioxygenase-like lactoylglutathione lyase family enzyme